MQTKLTKRMLTSTGGVRPCFTMVSFRWYEFPCICTQKERKKRQIRISKRFHVVLQLDKSLTVDFAESQVKKRVKKGGSLPSMMIYIGAS